MNKLLLAVCACLLGLSAQAGQDWRTEPDNVVAEQGVREYFSDIVLDGVNYDEQVRFKWITRKDIDDLRARFNNEFLSLRLYNDKTIVQLAVLFGEDAEVLRYVLGFSPNGDLVRAVEEGTQNMRPEFKTVFAAYREGRLRHANNGNADVPLRKSLFRGFGKEVLGVLGAMIFSALAYKYYKNSYNNRSTAVSVV